MNHGNAYTNTANDEDAQVALDIARPAPTEDRAGLYLLSFLLTADRVKAEQCTVAGLDLSAEDNPVFRDWARSWARQIVINNALRLIAPHLETDALDSDPGQSR